MLHLLLVRPSAGVVNTRQKSENYRLFGVFVRVFISNIRDWVLWPDCRDLFGDVDN